jgi:hypothetical protein
VSTTRAVPVLYHQIHPAKLSTDVSAAIVAVLFLAASAGDHSWSCTSCASHRVNRVHAGDRPSIGSETLCSLPRRQHRVYAARHQSEVLPTTVRRRHLSDEDADLLIDRWTAVRAGSRTSGQAAPKQSVARCEVRAAGRAQHSQLLPQRPVLQDQFPVSAERQRQRAADYDEQLQRRPRISPSRSRRRRGRRRCWCLDGRSAVQRTVQVTGPPSSDGVIGAVYSE